MTKALRIGGFVSGAILIVFGVVVIALAINARSTVTDSLKDEKIVGSPDMNPSDIEAAMTDRSAVLFGAARRTQTIVSYANHPLMAPSSLQ